MRLHMPGSTYRVLSEMVDAAISGTFVEGDYDETELSCLEAKWKQYLTGSVQAREQIEKEREVLRGLIADISHQTRTPLSTLSFIRNCFVRKIFRNMPESWQKACGGRRNVWNS